MAELKATRRSDLGTRKTRALRRQGLTPAIIYGHGKEDLAVAVDQHDLDVAITHGERVLAIDLGGETENVLVKEVQYDTFGQHILHVDLTRVSLTDRVEVTVPINLRGTPAGLAEGGVLQQQAAELTISCTVTEIPEEIRIQVSGLNVGDALQASDIELPEDMTLVDDPNMRICSVTTVAEEEPVEEAEEAETAEPEVITERKETDEAAPAEGEG